jgi:hypothetical protein
MSGTDCSKDNNPMNMVSIRLKPQETTNGKNIIQMLKD